jgi:hypothetical protein
MKFIENAKDAIEDPGFVQDLVELLVQLHHDWLVTEATVVPRICWVLTGHSFKNPPPTDIEREQLRHDAHSSRSQEEAIVRITKESKLREALRNRAAAVDEIQAVKNGAVSGAVADTRLRGHARLLGKWPTVQTSLGRKDGKR